MKSSAIATDDVEALTHQGVQPISLWMWRCCRQCSSRLKTKVDWVTIGERWVETQELIHHLLDQFP